MTIKKMPKSLSSLIAINDLDDPLFVFSELLVDDEFEDREIVYIVDSDSDVLLDLSPEKALELAEALTTVAQYAVNRERRAHQKTA